MINRKYHRIVFAFFMALLMSCVMALAISIFNVGLVSNIVYVWLRAWTFAFIVAFPIVIVVAPIVFNMLYCQA